ncbi:MAG: type VI secretion system TssO [Chitinophagaceae bacterium]
MKPLNRAERNNAFLGFLLLFLITIGIVLTVVFFSIKVPFSENEKLRSKVLMMQHEKNLSDSFRVAMNVALNELAKFNEKKEPAIVTKRSVQLKIERMGRFIKNMPEETSKEEKSIYDLVIQNLADLNDAKTRIRNLEDQQN